MSQKGCDVIEISKDHKLVLTYYKSNSETISYVVTKDKNNKYYLYSVDKDKLTKIKTANDPTKFKECYS